MLAVANVSPLTVTAKPTQDTTAVKSRVVTFCYVSCSDALLPLLQGFVKVVKNKAYFKRYQVKFRRRRGEAPCSVVFLHMFEVIFKYL